MTLLSHPGIDSKSQLVRERVFAQYKPLQYDKLAPFGPGDNIVSRLIPKQRETWRAVLPLQDARQDTGHAEIVVYFTIAIAGLVDLGPEALDVAIHAGTTHDIGYRLMEQALGMDINQTFRTVVAKGSAGREELLEIRRQHQAYAVAHIASTLADHPAVREISFIVGDHDTRLQRTTSAGKVMRDADMAWRLTEVCWRAYLANRTVAEAFAKMYDDARRDAYHAEESYIIARIEFANTVVRVYEEDLWPIDFKERYAAEIDFVRGYSKR